MNQSHVSTYLHGTAASDQDRLSLLNGLLNAGSRRELGLRGGERILELGSGLGQFARAMARDAGMRVVAIERSAEQIAEAERLAVQAGESDLVDFRLGDAARPPLRADEWGAFDVAHARFLLEHLRDPLAAVVAMVRAVRPGGRIVLEDDDHDLLRLHPEPPGFARLWQAYQGSYIYLGNDPGVGRRLITLLAEAGAEPVRNSCVFFGSCTGAPQFSACVANLIGVLAGARPVILQAGLLGAADFDRALAALHDWSRVRTSALWYAVAWAEGRRAA